MAHACCKLPRAEDASINICNALKAQNEKGKESGRGWSEGMSAEEQERLAFLNLKEPIESLSSCQLSATVQPWGPGIVKQEEVEWASD